MKFLLTLWFGCAALMTFAQSGTDGLCDRILSAEAMQEDFAVYCRVLRETHPGLYRYRSRREMDAKIDSVTQLLVEPLPFYTYYRHLAALTVDFRCAHTMVFPAKDINAYLESTIRMFPMYLYPIQGELYVVFNGAPESTIPPGSVVTRINSYSAAAISEKIRRHCWTDGFIEVAKNRALQGGMFGLFYYTIIERPDSFAVRYRAPDGSEGQVDLAARTVADMQKQIARHPLNADMLRYYDKGSRKSWELTFPEDTPSTALLRFAGFGGKGMNSTKSARRAMRKFMNRAMKQINQKKAKQLIIDVRSNTGGWDVHGVELISYLVKSDTAFRYYRRLHAVTNDSEFLIHSDLPVSELDQADKYLEKAADGTYWLKETDDSLLGLHSPKPNRFAGEVYILMDEGSASTTAEFVAVAKSARIATLVGEESAGAYEGGNGSSFISYALPNSGILLRSPLVAYQNAVAPPSLVGRGTLPDFRITMQQEDLLNNFDRQLAFVKEMIQREVVKIVNP